MFRYRRELVGVALALASFSTSARAEPRRARVFLDYARHDSARACISREQLVSAVEARLGRRVFVPALPADMIAEVRARRAGARFVVEVGMYDRDHHALGQRQLSTAARHCSALDDSLALVLSLAADAPSMDVGAPVIPAEPVPASPAAAPQAARLPAAQSTPITIPAATYAPRLGLRIEPDLGVALLMGPLPGATLGVQLGLTVRAAHFWPVSLRAGRWWPKTRRVGAERGARFSASSLEVGVCPWEGLLGELSFQACVLEWFGRVRARGSGFDVDERSERWLVALGTGGNVGHWFGPVFVSASASLLAPPVRRRYFFSDATESTTLHSEPWLFGNIGVRLGTEF